MFPSSGVRGKCGEQIFQSQIPCAGSFCCQRIHVILKATTTSLTERGNIYGKIDYTERGCQITGNQHCDSGCSAQQRSISYVQYVQNGCVYFTDAGLQEYIAKCTHRAKPVEKCDTYRKPRSAKG